MTRTSMMAVILASPLLACGEGDAANPKPAPVAAASLLPPAPAPLLATPSHGSMFGQVDVSLKGDFAALGAIESVTFGGIHGLNVRATSSEITVRIQGAPTPGVAEVVVTGKSGSRKDDAAFTYDPPVGGAPVTWASFGASLTQGFESGGLQAHGQLMSWDAQVARSAGVFLALPLVVDTLIPPIEPSAFVANCGASWNESMIANSLVQTLTDPATQMTDLRRGRQDATLKTRNFAIGGSTVADIIAPATGASGIIERIIELPDGTPAGFLGPALTRSQIDRLVMLDPDIGVSADLLANDSDGAVIASDDLHPEQMTPVATLAPELATLASRLGALHGRYFIGNLLPVDGLPNVAVLRQKTLASGAETAASFDAKLATIHGLIQAYNDALTSALAPYPNLTVIDVWTPTQSILSGGLLVGSVMLTAEDFGGLLSLDFLHFTDTGYAFLGNVFIDAINKAEGLRIPTIDVARVLASDALSPASLAKDGVHCPASG